MTTTPAGDGDVNALLHRGDQSAWQLAALATAWRGGPETPLTAAAHAVLAVVGLGAAPLAPDEQEGMAAQAAAPLLQAAAVVSGSPSWMQQSDEALLAQGGNSAQGARAFAEQLVPRLGDLSDRLRGPSGRILDVGTGVGALALAFAEQFPAVQVVGLDVLPRVLELAAATLAASPAGSRVELRQQDVAGFEDAVGFDLAWLPAPFVPEAALRPGLRRVADSLRPGGWLMLAHGRYGGDPIEDAVNRFKTVAFGGTALDDGQSEALLLEVGLSAVQHAPTPPGAPAIALARRSTEDALR